MHGICLDPTKLSFDYVPQVLPCREKQIEALRNLFIPTLSARIAQNAFLQGPVGTGKTVTARRFCMDFKKQCLNQNINFDYIHVNCRQKLSEINVMVTVIRNFDPNFPDRGFSVPDILEILARILNRGNMHFLIVLDEIDVILRRKSDIVYNLTRMNEGLLKEGRISLILISQINIFPFLDSSTLSTLKRTNQIKFERYSAEELFAILKARAEECLARGSYSEEVLEFIAEVASESGDARHALELLENAVLIAEAKGAKEITFEDVRSAKSREQGVELEMLNSLEKHEKLLLLAIAQATQAMASVSMGEVERRYAMLCELYGEKKRSHTQLWKYIQKLSSLGFITTKTEHRHGTTTMISLTQFSSKQIEEILENFL